MSISIATFSVIDLCKPNELKGIPFAKLSAEAEAQEEARIKEVRAIMAEHRAVGDKLHNDICWENGGELLPVKRPGKDKEFQPDDYMGCPDCKKIMKASSLTEYNWMEERVTLAKLLQRASGPAGFGRPPRAGAAVALAAAAPLRRWALRERRRAAPFNCPLLKNRSH